MPRLIVAHPHFTYPGGASAVALETAQRLTQDGYEVHVISLRHLPELAARAPDVRFHALGGPLSSSLRYWLGLPQVQQRFNRLVDALAPDALLAHVFPANYWAFAYRAARPAVPCVWYCHEPSAFVHDRHVIAGVPWPMRIAVLAANPPLQLIDRYLVRFADQIVANSPYTARRVRQIYRRAATIAAPGIDPLRFNPNGPKGPIVLAVGRLTHFKRMDLLIQAAARLKQRGYATAHFIIAGDGEEAGALRQLAADLAVEDCVFFAGRLSDAELVQQYNAARIVAVTAIGEPFGIVPLEGMAAGAALVCSDSGGPADTVQHGVTGLHFRSGDVADLADKLALLLDDPAQAVALGRRGRRMVELGYTWQHTSAGIRAALQLAAHERIKPRSGGWSGAPSDGAPG